MLVLLQAVAQQGAEAVAVRLGSLPGQSQAQLGGFKSRALRAVAPTHRHLYATEWRALDVADAAGAPLVVIGDVEVEAPKRVLSSCISREELAAAISGDDCVVASVVATQRASLSALPLFALEVALMLVQTQAAATAVPSVWLLTQGSQTLRRPAHAGSWGLARSARAEAMLPLQCIDDGPVSASLKRAEPEIVLRSDATRVPRLAQARQAPPVDSTIRDAGAHIVTGGTSGLGLLTARWLAQHGARALSLASRSGAMAREAAAEWEQLLAAADVATLVQRGDTSETTHVQRLMTISRRPLTGIWHAAGVLADAVLPKQTAGSLARSYGPKAHGAWTVHFACGCARLRTSAFFSSVAALLGGAGQANYAAANACLDALASGRRAGCMAAVSVQWGAWAEVGMAARGAASERMAAMEAASGFSRIGLAQGLAALGTAVQHGSSAVLAMVPVTWSRFLGAGEVPAFLSTFASKAKSAGTVGTGSASAACGVSLEAVLDMVKRTAGGSVDADAPLMEAGVDSLGAVELRNQLQGAAGGQSLPSTLVFDHPTTRQLASLLRPNQSTGVAATSSGNAVVSNGAGVGIDGMSALLPSGASSPWMAICMVGCGYDAIMQVPAVRWDVHAQPALPDPIASRV